MNQMFYPLVVSDTISEINGMAKTVQFDIPESLKQTFSWTAGQHLAVRFVLNGEEERRSYSISSSPVSGEPMQITVKRVVDGRVSNHINNTINKGDTIEVIPPFGSFCLTAEPHERRTHYFFAAGSGITPLYAMLHSVMCNEPHSFACLAYGNKNAGSILFSEKLARLAETHSERLAVEHVLSAPSLWQQFKYWRKGTIDSGAVNAMISEHPPYAQDTRYYICGPGSMNESVRTALMQLDVPAYRIHTESYGGASDFDDSINGIAATARVTLNQSVQEVSISDNQTVLEAVRAAGLNPPFSCQSGVCGACRARLTEGSVHMRTRIALDESEIGKGDILTCQSLATSEFLSVNYD